MKIEIKHRWNGSVMFSLETESIKLCVIAALKAKVSLRDADLSDADLSDADLSGADLRGAVLSGADLRGADLRGAVLSGAVLRDADLSGAVLSGAVLRGAVLSDADLSDADLRGADLRGAVLRGAVLSEGLLKSLKVENLDSKILAAIADGGKLNMSGWHSCETTHCRAGWAITLCPHGKVVEGLVGPSAAGALIYAASYPKLPVPDFHTDDESALKDMKERAKTDATKAAK